MLSEQINFTYILHAAQIAKPITVTASVNGTQVATATISKNGKVEFVVATDLQQGHADLVLHIPQTIGATITVNAVRMLWVNENSSINSTWTGREPGANEIWNYNEPEIAQVLALDAQVPKHRTIMLEYETDGRKSFLRNYATISTGGHQFNLRNRTGPYSFNDQGNFCLPMASPVSYWLMERLFVAI